MFFSISKEYTNSYSTVNANSYSTPSYTESHNSSMEFKTWLQREIDEIGIDPTALSRLVDGLNQPTIQRVLSGETPNPRLKTTDKIRKAVEIARRNANLSPSSYIPIGSDEGESEADGRASVPEDPFLAEVAKGVQIHELPDHIKQTILTLISSSPEKK